MTFAGENVGEGAVELIGAGDFEEDGLVSQTVDQVVESPVGEALAPIRRVDCSKTHLDRPVGGLDVDRVSVVDSGDLTEDSLVAGRR